MVIRPVGEHQWEDINWNDEGHRSCINTGWGPIVDCYTPAWLPWVADDRLHAHGSTER
jgi:hypothetical protein